MRTFLSPSAALAALISLTAPSAATPAPAPSGTDDQPAPRVPPPFFHHGPDEADPDAFPGYPGLKSPFGSSRPAPDPDMSLGEVPGRKAVGAPPPPPTKPPTRAETLDRLMHRLAEARDADEAKGIAALVQRLWMDSGSATADLLMTRALAAMDEKRTDVAAALLDKLIELRPAWAEAWNKRATLRFLDGDDTGAMEDISHTLALEPRHFGALGGMGFILARHGEEAAALRTMRRALSIYPADEEIEKAVGKLAPLVEGRDL